MGKGRAVETGINNAPLVSIVLPTFNRAKMLERAIESVVKQSYLNWELIIVDNSSSDNTDEVVANFKNNKIRLLKIQNNGSIGKSRNYGIQNSRGEWVAFIDSDDWWLPNKLRDCVAECTDMVDLIFHDLLISEGGKIIKSKKIKGRNLNSPILDDLILNGNVLSNSSVIVRISILKAIGYINEDININPSVDFNTWLKVASITHRFKYISKALGVYLIHEGGASQRDMSISYWHAVKSFTKHFSKNKMNQLRRNIYFIHGKYEFKNKRYKKAERPLKKALDFNNFEKAVKILFMLLCIKVKIFINPLKVSK